MFNAELTYRITIQWGYAAMNDATMNECYNEQFLSIKSGCYNECGGILLADIARMCA